MSLTAKCGKKYATICLRIWVSNSSFILIFVLNTALLHYYHGFLSFSLFQIIFTAICSMVLCRPENLVRVSQDTAGNYDIEYNLEDSFRKEVKLNGVVYGSYSYIDSNGVVQTVQYTAGPRTGFLVLDSTNMPSAPVAPVVPVHYSADVAAAGANHLEFLKQAYKNGVKV